RGARALALDQRLARAGARHLEARGIDPPLDQPATHRLGARRRQLVVALAARVDVDADAQARDLAAGPQGGADLAEHAGARAQQHGRVAAEADRLEQLEAILGDQDQALAAIRTAVVVLVAVDRLRLRRAAVEGVEHAVAIVVRIRAAVVVGVAVGVLRLAGAAVVDVRHAVAVVVAVGAAVAVLEAIEILRLARARVVDVGPAVAVVVEVRAAVLVLEAVAVLAVLRTEVARRRHAVAVEIEA